MRVYFVLLCLAGCGVEPPPRAPSSLAVEASPPTEVLTYRIHDSELGDSVRDVTAASWLGMSFANLAPGDRLDVESCTSQSCTYTFTPKKTGETIWLEVDRATRRPTSVQWIAHSAVESCDHLALTPDRTAIASATCTRIVDRVGEEIETWTLVDRKSSAPSVSPSSLGLL